VDTNWSAAVCVSTTEAPVDGGVPAGVPDDVLGVCWSSALETAAAQETVPAVVDQRPLWPVCAAEVFRKGTFWSANSISKSARSTSEIKH